MRQVMEARHHLLLFESIEDELLKEIQQLSGERLDSGLPRHVYLERLHQLKRKKIFPFLDLPAELRNLIYPDLLVHNRREGSVAYPAILRTCKQLYKECSPILNADSLSKLSIGFTGQDKTGRLDYFARGEFHSKRLKEVSDIDDFLHKIRYVQQIAITVGPMISWDAPGTTLMASRLLARFLAGVMEKITLMKGLKIEVAQIWNETFEEASYFDLPKDRDCDIYEHDLHLELLGLTEEEYEQVLCHGRSLRDFDVHDE